MDFNASLFEELLQSVTQKETDDQEWTDVLESLESVNVKIDDDFINNSNCKLIAYNIHVSEDDNVEAYNPKKNPYKAISIFFNTDENTKINIFLDTKTKEWDSDINDNQGKLSPEQMEVFFKTDFYKKLCEKLYTVWPETDPLFSELLNALKVKKFRIDYNLNQEKVNEGSYKFKTHNVKVGKAREKNAAGKQIRTNSGRLIVNFSDMSVNLGEEEAYYSWPGKLRKGDQHKWSRWADWNKQRPLIRYRFGYSIGQNKDVIGLSLSPFMEDDKNRGFKSYNLSLRPILQYLTPQETEDILHLSVVRKFLKTALQRMITILDVPDEDILKNLNNPEKCTIDDIRKTKHVIKNSIKAIRDLRADTFVYT